MLSGPPENSPLVETTVEGDESVVNAVTESVAALADTPIVELPPLYESIDPDALQVLFRSLRSEGYLVFSYHGYDVLVWSEGTVEVYESSPEPPSD